jgi:Fe-S-cluster containining protein
MTLLLFHRLRFFLRWVVFYNIELVWLSWRLPKIPAGAALGSAADERRREAHIALAGATANCGDVCADCGRCCLEDVNRFTAFDQIVREGSDSPAPSWDNRIYSVPWMIYNAVTHTVQRLLRTKVKSPPCSHLSPDGCSLARQDRPMICVSWFCPRAAFAMDSKSMNAAEAPLRVIEGLHRDALRTARMVVRE